MKKKVKAKSKKSASPVRKRGGAIDWSRTRAKTRARGANARILEQEFMLDVIAEKVVDDANALLGTKFPEVLRGGERVVGQIPYDPAVAHLVEYAKTVYAASEGFRKKVITDNNRGRNRLYTFMEHWLASYLKKSYPKLYRALPHGYGWSYSPTVHGLR